MPDKDGRKKSFSRSWGTLTPPLEEWILEAVMAWGFPSMTPVQAATIPLFLGNKDVVVEAVTGSGKTLAFLIPMVSRLLRLEEPTKRHHIGGIIVTPTRELASQIHDVLVSLLGFHAASAELLPYLQGSSDEKRPMTAAPVIVPQLLVGGISKASQDLSFFLKQSSNLLVGTPGRLAELLSSSHVHAPQSSFEMLVLDEADRLLDLGFKQDLERILGFLPKQRRTGLFSASVSEAVGEIIRAGLRNPQRVTVTVKSLRDGAIVDAKTPASLQMSYLVTPASSKLLTLAQLLEKLEPRPQRSIVFLSTCRAVEYFKILLGSVLPQGFTLIPLHGKLKPAVREKCFQRFVSSSSPAVLLTTDVAARGLDIPQVDLVVQIDPPSDYRVFLHRAGRAGRAGRRGLAVVMLQPGPEEDFVPFLDVRKTPITPLERPVISVTDEQVDTTVAAVRELAQQDRAVFELAQQAFVSWVRAYLEHRSSIFPVEKLDWFDLAKGWGLLELPKMPEIKSLGLDRSLGLGIKTYAIAFTDSAREKKRQQMMAERKTSASKIREDRIAMKKRNEAWSNKHDREDLQEARRNRKKRRMEAQRVAKMTPEEVEEKRQLDALLVKVRKQNRDAANDGTKGTADFEGFAD